MKNLRDIMAPADIRTKAIDSILTMDEFNAMMAAGKNAKDKAIMCLGIIGLRAGEIAAADKTWVDFSARTIKIPATVAKRKKARLVPFGKLNRVPAILQGFFDLEDGIKLSRIQVWNRVKGMASRAGITHPVTPHGLRATGATWFAMNGYSITGLMNHFGWSELRTAQHYIMASGASAMQDMEQHGENIL
jgi:integrase